MSLLINEERLMDSPKRTESTDIQSDSQKVKKEFNTFFLGVQQTSKVTRQYIDTKTHGIQLYYQEFTPQFIDAQVIIVHGFGEHSGNYKQLTDCFLLNNFKVHLYDQRGFGFSGGIRSKATIEEMHMDLETVIDQIDKSVPLFIFCHALGAAIVISFCLRNPQFEIQGIICSSAQFRVPPRYGKMKMITLQMMAKLCPDLQVNTYHNLSFASKNNHHIRKLATDRLIHPYMSIQFAQNVLLFQQYILPNANQFKIPILILHGKQNKVASHLDSVDFYMQIQSKEKTIKIFEQGFHEMHNDSEWPKMKTIITQWCQKMITKDVKMNYLKEYNHGVVVQQYRSKIRLLISVLLIVIRRKLSCLNVSTKVSILIFMELLLRLFTSH
ncbi:unnamed protein product (macronuclear) [Paramecium tetraurelia]|uniref:Serine aminopeptidase S33 domain-containing protein n=1 Tax=Paramecium tetraurelia TaxID=5888 RepID=A0DRP9_PARTE|nr:uncharacterized protein GSPATT00019434001 [Paramecium tetraurelia]CAK85716.1 unnamed protein product [Paramecium tetraurelia]|eukprot:XP_001453113.1 hypothetical protein (macronuclear) [Paramecium tetraurelia strain d4-2]